MSMRNTQRTWIIIVALLATTITASAQVAEMGAYGGMFRLSGNDIATADGYDYTLDDGWLFGARLTLNTYRFFGHEFGYAYNRTTMAVRASSGGGSETAGTAIHRGTYNFLLYALPEGAPVRPFATGGLHFNTYAWPGYSAAQGGGSTKFGLNYGGGIKVRVSPKYGIRFDIRNYKNGKPFGFLDPDGSIDQMVFTAGFSVLL